MIERPVMENHSRLPRSPGELQGSDERSSRVLILIVPRPGEKANCFEQVKYGSHGFHG